MKIFRKLKFMWIALARKIKKLVKLIFLGSDNGPHITRYQMYKSLSLIQGLPKNNILILDISHSHHLIEILNLQSADSKIITANYPDNSLLHLKFPDSQFDYVVADQVLEHVKGDPFTAANEIKRVLKPGGYAIITTCFINPVHNMPGDYWRFTTDALELLFADFQKILVSESWGNKYVWLIDAMGMRFTPIPNKNWHPLNKIARYNDSEWPIVTWVIAKK